MYAINADHWVAAKNLLSAAFNISSTETTYYNNHISKIIETLIIPQTHTSTVLYVIYVVIRRTNFSFHFANPVVSTFFDQSPLDYFAASFVEIVDHPWVLLVDMRPQRASRSATDRCPAVWNCKTSGVCYERRVLSSLLWFGNGFIVVVRVFLRISWMLLSNRTIRIPARWWTFMLIMSTCIDFGCKL